MVRTYYGRFGGRLLLGTLLAVDTSILGSKLALLVCEVSWKKDVFHRPSLSVFERILKAQYDQFSGTVGPSKNLVV